MFKQPRKVQECKRCLKVKYVGGVGSADNHKKFHCADGVKSKDKKDPSPPWPQPDGIFSAGTHFHPLVFLQTFRLLFEKLAIENADGADLDAELLAFAEMVHKRTITVDVDGGGQNVLFRLYDHLTMSPHFPQIVATHEGKQYLRIDCISDGPQVSTTAGPPLQMSSSTCPQ